MRENKPKFHHKVIHHCKRVKHHAKHFFIPHSGNDHKPHALRAPAIRIYASLLILIKLFVTGFLFLAYPSLGEFASITTSEILVLTNASRSQENVAPLTLNVKLNQAAQLKAQDMIADNYFAHTAPDGTKPWAFLKEAGYSYQAAGENLAMDFTNAESVHTAFMNSPSHQKNILNSKYTEMGIAIISGKLDGRDTILLVEFFGKPYEVAQAAPLPTPTPTPTTEPKPAPAPTPTPTPKPAPQPLYYKAELSDQSAKELGIKPLERISYWVDFKNTGTATWTNEGQYFVALNVTNPASRTSSFQDETWIEYYRPAKLSQKEVKPGEIGKFEFYLKSPEQAGAYEEDFGLVAENLTWIDGGSIELPIVVVAQPELITETTVEKTGADGTTQPKTNTNVNQATPSPTNANLNVNQPIVAITNANQNVNQETIPAPSEEKQIIVKAENIGEKKEGFTGKIIEYSQRFYLIFLVFIVIVLLINILVEIKVQHPHIITQAVLIIILTGAAILVRPHFLEKIPQMLKII